MAIIVDANCISRVFDKTDKEHEEFEPVHKWIISGKGVLIYGGTKYLKELSKFKRVLSLINKLKNYKNKVVVLDNDLVDTEEKRIENAVNDKEFDDPHIAAIVSVSKCRLICSLDARSETFILRSDIYPNGVKPPKFYKGKRHTHLLCDSNIPEKYKPLQKLNKKEKTSIIGEQSMIDKKQSSNTGYNKKSKVRGNKKLSDNRSKEAQASHT